MVDGFIKKFSISKLSGVGCEPFFSYVWSFCVVYLQCFFLFFFTLNFPIFRLKD